MTRRWFVLALLSLLPAWPAAGKELKPWSGGATPPLTLPDLRGQTHSLEDYRGQVVLVNFWATWCPPCIQEMPSMQRLKERMDGKPFAILAVDMGESEFQVREFLKEVKVDFTILLDNAGTALKTWKVRAFPTSYVLDAEGRIRYGLFGAKEWDDADAVAKINALVAEANAGRPATAQASR
jgi:thiol-disulfide isomerase/thioredoxin